MDFLRFRVGVNGEDAGDVEDCCLRLLYDFEDLNGGVLGDLFSLFGEFVS
jgi:hypothetical protein